MPPTINSFSNKSLAVRCGDVAFHAVDISNGGEKWRVPLSRRANATPMTYRSKNGRQFVVIATGGGEDATLVAFALGQTPSSGGHE